MLRMLRLYQRWVSPSLPPSCRYVPTCSEYAMEAIQRYGALRGGTLAIWRLIRCHPFVKGGLDPVVKHSTHPKVRDEWRTHDLAPRMADSERRTASY